MKKTLRRITRRVVKNDISWSLLSPLIKLSDYLRIQRNSVEEKPKIENQKFVKLLSTRTVMNGPFKGLKYPDLSSFGSTMFPKILGSYEYEIYPIIEEICKKPYTEVLNIGSAEGYYTVGLALRLPDAKIFAFDIDDRANDFCRSMAKLNNVSDRIEIKEKCTADTLAGFRFSGKALILCDCEGYEKQLFNEANLANLSNCDLLIETHDFIDISISTYLEALFSKTHNIQVVQSVDDIIKAKSYDFEEIKDFSLIEKKQILSECRPSVMEWFYLEPKAN